MIEYLFLCEQPIQIRSGDEQMGAKFFLTVGSFFILSSALTVYADNHSAMLITDASLPKKQWYLDKIGMEDAWVLAGERDDVIVAIIDTGVDLDHEDLSGQFWVNANEISGNGIDDDGNGFIDDMHGWDFQSNDNYPDDEDDYNIGHGTIAAGVIAAGSNNGFGIEGMSPNVKIMAIRAFSRTGTSSVKIMAEAIDYAVANGAQIINASWGGSATGLDAKPCTDALMRAQRKGVIFVNAAGNYNTNTDVDAWFPGDADFDNIIVVAASTKDDKKWVGSNYGKRSVDIAAPGTEIFTTLMGNRYDFVTGTSIAAPVVSGLIALMKSVDKTLDGARAKAILQNTGAPVLIDTACNCRIDASKAMRAISVL